MVIASTDVSLFPTCNISRQESSQRYLISCFLQARVNRQQEWFNHEEHCIMYRRLFGSTRHRLILSSVKGGYTLITSIFNNEGKREYL